MSIDTYFRLGFGLLAAVLLIKPLRALSTGHFSVRFGGTFARHEDGSRFWVEVGCEIAFLAIFLAIVCFWPGGQDEPPPVIHPLMAGVFAMLVVRALLTGSIDWWGSQIDREDRPGRYWMWVAIEAAVAGMAAFLAMAGLLR